MIWSTSSVVLSLVCYIHGTSAAIYGVSAVFQQSIYAKIISTELTASDLKIECHRVAHPNLEDCYSALRLIEIQLK